MSLVLADRVKETTATTGTGTINLAGPAPQFQSFAAAIGNGNTTFYCIMSGNGTDWEVGLGTVTTGSPNTLSRTTIFASSNSGSAISLTGTSTAFCTNPAGGNVVLKGATSGSLLIKPAAAAGANTLTLPAGTTDFSATGGASQVVKQTSSGGALTVGQLATSDLSTVAAAPGAGQLGQEISSTVLIGSAVSLTSGGVSDVASITLTAGVWMVWGNIALSSGGTTNIITVQGWTSPTSASVPTRPNNGALTNLPSVFTTGTNPVIPTGQQVIVVASGTQSVFLTVTTTFNTSTLAAYGFIGAVRIA